MRVLLSRWCTHLGMDIAFGLAGNVRSALIEWPTYGYSASGHIWTFPSIQFVVHHRVSHTVRLLPSLPLKIRTSPDCNRGSKIACDLHQRIHWSVSNWIWNLCYSSKHLAWDLKRLGPYRPDTKCLFGYLFIGFAWYQYVTFLLHFSILDVLHFHKTSQIPRILNVIWRTLFWVSFLFCKTQPALRSFLANLEFSDCLHLVGWPMTDEPRVTIRG